MGIIHATRAFAPKRNRRMRKTIAVKTQHPMKMLLPGSDQSLQWRPYREANTPLFMSGPSGGGTFIVLGRRRLDCHREFWRISRLKNMRSFLLHPKRVLIPSRASSVLHPKRATANGYYTIGSLQEKLAFVLLSPLESYTAGSVPCRSTSHSFCSH